MRYYYRLFLWENGQKAMELTNYLVAPLFLEDRLNEELDSGEIILDKVPITQKSPFAPKTKFRIERYKNSTYTDEPKIWDMMVDHDDVEEYMGADEFCCHRIFLTEPSVVAQGMHIDNISLTYELQDVTTNYKTYSSDLTNVAPNVQNGGYTYPIHELSEETESTSTQYGYTSSTTGKFKNTYAYIWDQQDLAEFNNLKLNLEISQNNPIYFNIPRLYCYGSSNGQSFDKQLFQINTTCRIYRYETQNGEIIDSTKTLILSQTSGPSNITVADNEWYYSDGSAASLRIINPGDETGIGIAFATRYGAAPIISRIGNYQSSVSFTTATLSDAEIENGKGYKYFIEIFANPENSDGLLDHYESGYYNFLSFSSIYGVIRKVSYDP